MNTTSLARKKKQERKLLSI